MDTLHNFVCIYSLRRCKITAFEINNFATKYVEKHVYGGGNSTYWFSIH